MQCMRPASAVERAVVVTRRSARIHDLRYAANSLAPIKKAASQMANGFLDRWESEIKVSVAGRPRTMRLVLPASQAVGPSSRA